MDSEVIFKVSKKYISQLLTVFCHVLEKNCQAPRSIFNCGLICCCVVGKGTTTGIWPSLPQEMTGRRPQKTASWLTKPLATSP